MRISEYLKNSLLYLAVFLLGAFAATSFSPFATISRQARISAITDESAASFPLAVGTTWEYEGWARQQQGQELNPAQQDYHVVETVLQEDVARSGDSQLITLRHEETIGTQPTTMSTVGYFIQDHRYYRIENDVSLDAIRKYLYGDTSDMDIISDLLKTPTYDFSTPIQGCHLVHNNDLSSDYSETFCDGVGPISMHYMHHGTIDEYSLELVKSGTN